VGRDDTAGVAEPFTTWRRRTRASANNASG
jgi:hypothetical protein